VVYGGAYTTGYINNDSGYSVTAFKTVHSTLAAGTAVEFKVQFTSGVSGESVILGYDESSITMTLSEVAQ